MRSPISGQRALPTGFAALQILGSMLTGLSAATLFTRLREESIHALPPLASLYAACSLLASGMLLLCANGARVFTHAKNNRGT